MVLAAAHLDHNPRNNRRRNLKSLCQQARQYAEQRYGKFEEIWQAWRKATPCSPAFIADYNARFAKAPANNKDLHRPLHAGDDLDDAFAWKEERTLSQALTLQYDKIMFILEPSEPAKPAIGKRVTVVDRPDGRLSVRYKGVELAYRTFDMLRQVSQAAIVENKRLGAALAFICEQQIKLLMISLVDASIAEISKRRTLCRPAPGATQFALGLG